jgi:hypothetical protein
VRMFQVGEAFYAPLQSQSIEAPVRPGTNQHRSNPRATAGRSRPSACILLKSRPS